MLTSFERAVVVVLPSLPIIMMRVLPLRSMRRTSRVKICISGDNGSESSISIALCGGGVCAVPFIHQLLIIIILLLLLLIF